MRYDWLTPKRAVQLSDALIKSGLYIYWTEEHYIPSNARKPIRVTCEGRVRNFDVSMSYSDPRGCVNHARFDVFGYSYPIDLRHVRTIVRSAFPKTGAA